MHLVIDGYGADPGYISDEGRILTFLQEYPHAISMTPISSPQVLTFRGKGSKRLGSVGVYSHSRESYQRAYISRQGLR